MIAVVNSKPPEECAPSIAEAASALASGSLVVFPTETVYGLGASARQPEAVARIYQIKRRPADKAMIIHVREPAAIDAWASSVPPWARRLAEHYWPGPVTLVLPRQAHVADVITGSGPTVALRAPDHPLTRELIAELARREGHAHGGIVGPSANLHGKVPPTSRAMVASAMGEGMSEIHGVLDGGQCQLGIESTVIDASGEQLRIFRSGAIPTAEIEQFLGMEAAIVSASTTQKSSDGNLILFDFPAGGRPKNLVAGDAVIARYEQPSREEGGILEGVLWLELPQQDEGFAREFYPTLRKLEAQGLKRVHVERAQNKGLGPAINARIDRYRSSSSG